MLYVVCACTCGCACTCSCVRVCACVRVRVHVGVTHSLPLPKDERDAATGYELYALEINLRQGGTTHPIMTLRLLTGGVYEAETGRFRAEDGQYK